MNNSMVAHLWAHEQENGLPYKYECSNGTLWDYCIHFEGNEHLLGTNKNG